MYGLFECMVAANGKHTGYKISLLNMVVQLSVLHRRYCNSGLGKAVESGQSGESAVIRVYSTRFVVAYPSLKCTKMNSKLTKRKFKTNVARFIVGS